MSKRRLLHDRTLLHEAVLWSVVTLVLAVPLVAVFYYSRGDDLSSVGWARVVLIAVAVGAARGLRNWFKNTR